MFAPRLRRIAQTDYFAHDGLFWRRMAAVGARRFPAWWVRYSPPLFGVAAAVALPGARRAVRSNLRRIRGDGSFLRDVIDTTQTFTSYAGCLAETLSMGSKNHLSPEVEVVGRAHVLRAVAANRGMLLLTMHTGGWEAAGPLLAEHTSLDVALVMEEERVAGCAGPARSHRGSRPAFGSSTSAPILSPRFRSSATSWSAREQPPCKSIGSRRAAARSPCGCWTAPRRCRRGPFVWRSSPARRWSPCFAGVAVTGVTRSKRTKARTLPRRATAEQVAAVAQTVADDMTRFLRAHPTQWFEWGTQP